MKKIILLICLMVAAGPAWATNILPLGDSVTSSYSPHLSYRYWLWEMLAKAKRDVHFVGSQHGVANGAPGDPPLGHLPWDPNEQSHEGHPGWRADDGANNAFGIALSTRPDIVLLDLGANDVEWDQNNAETKEEVRAIIQRIRMVNPNVVIILAIPTPTHINLKQLQQFIPLLKKLAREENQKNSPVKIADLYSGFSSRGDTFDGEHPDESGEIKIARKYYSAILPYLRKK